MIKKTFVGSLVGLLIALFIFKLTSPFNGRIVDAAGNDHVVISEVYGGGGQPGATYKNDFVELYNPTSSSVSFADWSIQYTSATGTSWASNKTVLTGSITAHAYFLIQLAGGATGSTLPTADLTGTTNMAGTAGKLLLVNSATAVSAVVNPTDSNIVDKVGYGTTANGYETSYTPAITIAISAQRKLPLFDTNNNSADFKVVTPVPQNSASSTYLPLAADFSSWMLDTVRTETCSVKYSNAITIYNSLSQTEKDNFNETNYPLAYPRYQNWIIANPA